MQFFEIFLTAIALSMDAFAAATCKGLSMRKFHFSHAVLTGLYFGTFQALMPLIGYFLGINFAERITRYDHWIAFVLLGFLGLKMLYDALGAKSESKLDDSLDFKTMVLLSVATSIDALAMGVSFAVLQIKIIPAVSVIGIITFLLSAIGVRIGSLFGSTFKRGAEMAGGIVLLCIGIRIVVSHLS